MCGPCDNYGLGYFDINDKYMGRQLVAQKLTNYITLNPTLPHKTTHYYYSSPGPEVPLEVYIARVIYASMVPDIVAYAALYLLGSIAQVGQPQVPHDENKWNYALSSPSKLSHVLFRAVIGTPFSRAVKSHWDERHLFVGAFYLAIMAYKPVFEEEHHKELIYQNMIGFSGIPEEVIKDISAAFKKCVSYELQTAVDLMLREEFVLDLSELDCPLVLARQRLSSKLKDGNGNEKGQKRRMGLKRSINSFWKSREKAIPVESGLRGRKIVIVGRT